MAAMSSTDGASANLLSSFASAVNLKELKLSLMMDDLLPTLRKLEEVLAVFGLIYISKVGINTLWDIAVGLRAHVYSRLWRKNFVQRFGKWAVVTGCTDGIGKCYAEELAKEGLNLVLISRTMEKLNRVATELSSKYKIETEVIQIDFSEGRPVYERIAKHLGDKEIGMLINNVGVILNHPKYYLDITEDEVWSHVNVNIGAVCGMTKLILPQMVNRGRGAVVNIASIAGNGPIPLLSVYSASKAFVDNFSRALEWEYRSKGITIQTLIPSYIATNMTSYSPLVGTEGFVCPSPKVFASHAVATIGYTKRTAGYWVHGFQAWLAHKVMTSWFFSTFMGYTQIFFISQMKNHRL